MFIKELRATYRKVKTALPRDAIKNPESAETIARSFLGNAAEERFLLFALDVKNKLIAVSHIGIGSVTGCSVDPGVLFRNALLANAAAFIVVHNHPSGDQQPSTEDNRLTERIRDGAKLLGLSFLDHLIVGEGTYSYAKEKPGVLK